MPASSIVVEKCIALGRMRGRTCISWDRDGRITEIAETAEAPSGGHLAIPGLIDSHFHGFAGVDLLNGIPSPDELERMDSALLAHGVTSYLPAICPGSVEHIAELAAAIRAASPDGLIGLHSEGPFVNPACAGALPKQQFRGIDLDLCQEMLAAAEGLIRIMMVSPEMPRACSLIEFLRESNIIPAIGHSGADFEQTRAAVDAGALRATHWPNAMRWGDHHHPGIAMAVLTDNRVFLEVIGDSTHMHPSVAGLAVRCKGDRLVCVSDSLSLAGCGAGVSSPGLELRDGRLLLAGTCVHAGSAEPFDGCFHNLVSRFELPLKLASNACSANAAASLGISELGDLSAGKRADFLIIDEDHHIQTAYRKGQRWTKNIS